MSLVEAFLIVFQQPALLATDDVNHAKDNHPHPIDKMPVPREHLDMLGVRPRHVSAQAQDQDQHEQDQTDNDVSSVQADHGVEGRPEKISADREVVFKDQPLPFGGGGAEECHREDNGEQPPELKASSASASKGALSQHDGQAAG